VEEKTYEEIVITYPPDKSGKSKTLVKQIENETFYLPCDCGCGIIGVSAWGIDDEEDSYMVYYESAFYAHNKPFIKRLKMIWEIISGKEYRFYEVTVSNKTLRHFVNRISNYLDREKEIK
jgi:hypothetical protein